LKEEVSDAAYGTVKPLMEFSRENEVEIVEGLGGNTDASSD